jgi:FO synthase
MDRLNVLSDLESALEIADAPLELLMARARALRDAHKPGVVTYSRKVFIPLTRLCRDVCRYCTFATTPSDLPAPYLSLDEVVAIAEAGHAAGCDEALFTLGDRPEARYSAARRWLEEHGYHSTVDYLAAAAAAVVERTGLLPHLNAGVLDESEYRRLRPFAASMGLMLESSSKRLCERGGPHHGCPDKDPDLRLASLAAAGRAGIAMTSGLLIGIGETRRERLEALFLLRKLQLEHGHLQEVIVQNFVPKPDTPMRNMPAAALDELCWTIAMARLVLGAELGLQAPPNLNPTDLGRLIAAGIDDWGGVSPVTPDHINPESRWPSLAALERDTAAADRTLVPRLTIYPRFVREPTRWLDPAMRPHVLRRSDASGLAREDDWTAGSATQPPSRRRRLHAAMPIDLTLLRASRGDPLQQHELVTLLEARGGAVDAIVAAADGLRRARCGDVVSFVVNRNINYTNICTHRCGFCAFSKGRSHRALRGKAYLLDLDELAARAIEAAARGATEVCMQGGIHPSFTGQTYLDLLRAVKQAVPAMHVHAFSPLEVTHGARTLGLSVPAFLERLRDAGLGSLPGTAAEILDDAVRDLICPDKLRSHEWLAVVEAAHRVGLRTTSTMMFGTVETPRSWAQHLLALRALQARTGGITEFVPLPFVHMEAPLFRRGQARRGPTWREIVLVHAVARLALHPLVENIQASWVKLGPQGAAQMLDAGANDLGGVLMNESISRAAGATHGQELDAAAMTALIESCGRRPRQRTTLYADAKTAGAAILREADLPPGAVSNA